MSKSEVKKVVLPWPSKVLVSPTIPPLPHVYQHRLDDWKKIRFKIG